MDSMTMECIIRLMIKGMESVSEALQLALLKYQDKVEEEHYVGTEREDADE